MKKVVFILLLLCNAGITGAQSLPSFRGWGPYLLGQSRSSFDTSIALVNGGVFAWKGDTTYTYQQRSVFSHPIQVGGTSLNNLLLTFSRDQKLMTIELFRMFLHTDSTNYLAAAQQCLKTVKAVLDSSLVVRAKKKTFYSKKEIEDKGYLWTKGANTVTLKLYHSKTKQRPFASVSLIFQAPRGG